MPWAPGAVGLGTEKRICIVSRSQSASTCSTRTLDWHQPFCTDFEPASLHVHASIQGLQCGHIPERSREPPRDSTAQASPKPPPLSAAPCHLGFRAFPRELELGNFSQAGIRSSLLREASPTRFSGFHKNQVHPRSLDLHSAGGKEEKKPDARSQASAGYCNLGTLEVATQEGSPPSVDMDDSSPHRLLCELFLGHQQDQDFEFHCVSTFVPCENSRAFWRKRRNIEGLTNVRGSVTSLPFVKGKRLRLSRSQLSLGTAGTRAGREGCESFIVSQKSPPI